MLRTACATPTHWAFAGTGLSDGDLFGQASLHRRCPGGASGHETDKISPSSPAGVVCLAKGTNIDDGGAELSYYETPSGGAVFSAGSIAWPSAILVDDCVSQITANVLRRFLAVRGQRQGLAASAESTCSGEDLSASPG